MCTRIRRRRARRAIEKLPPKLRGQAMKWLNMKVMERYGSGAALTRRQKRVTAKQKALMMSFHEAGMPYRTIERVMHLVPNSGNGAQRCVRAAMEMALG